MGHESKAGQSRIRVPFEPAGLTREIVRGVRERMSGHNRLIAGQETNDLIKTEKATLGRFGQSVRELVRRPFGQRGEGSHVRNEAGQPPNEPPGARGRRVSEFPEHRPTWEEATQFMQPFDGEQPEVGTEEQDAVKRKFDAVIQKVLKVNHKDVRSNSWLGSVVMKRMDFDGGDYALLEIHSRRSWLIEIPDVLEEKAEIAGGVRNEVTEGGSITIKYVTPNSPLPNRYYEYFPDYDHGVIRRHESQDSVLKASDTDVDLTEPIARVEAEIFGMTLGTPVQIGNDLRENQDLETNMKLNHYPIGLIEVYGLENFITRAPVIPH